MKEILLKPIKESAEDWDKLEQTLVEWFRKEIYVPVFKSLGASPVRLTNSRTDLYDALRSGRVSFGQGAFSGRFNASVSRELEEMGARWDRRRAAWLIRKSALPLDVIQVIEASTSQFKRKLAAIDKELAQILPEEIAGKLSVEQIFDASLWKVDREFRETVKSITVSPTLTDEARKRIASEWQTNMRLWVKDFTEAEIIKLRTNLKTAAFAGNRYESAVKTIQKSFGVSQNKAKFLARQETSLLMTKFKETRYSEAGVMEYRWGCVAGSKFHPVRPWHKALEGKVFRWDDPPITTKPGEPVRRNNPGQDYNCRCFAKPIVRFRDSEAKR